MPGAVVCAKAKVVLNEGRKRIKLKVTSKGDRPIQVRYCLMGTRHSDFSRLDHITTLSKQIHSLISIA